MEVLVSAAFAFRSPLVSNPEPRLRALEAALRHAKFNVDMAATLIVDGIVQIEQPTIKDFQMFVVWK